MASVKNEPKREKTEERVTLKKQWQKFTGEKMNSEASQGHWVQSSAVQYILDNNVG